MSARSIPLSYASSPPAIPCGLCISATSLQRLLRAVRGLRAARACRTAISAAALAARSRSRMPMSLPPCFRIRCAAFSIPAPRSAPPADNSCLMHIGGGLSRQRTGVAAFTSRRSWPRPKRREIERSRRRSRASPDFPNAAKKLLANHPASAQRPPRDRRHSQQARPRRRRDGRLGTTARSRPCQIKAAHARPISIPISNSSNLHAPRPAAGPLGPRRR